MQGEDIENTGRGGGYFEVKIQTDAGIVVSCLIWKVFFDYVEFLDTGTDRFALNDVPFQAGQRYGSHRVVLHDSGQPTGLYHAMHTQSIYHLQLQTQMAIAAGAHITKRIQGVGTSSYDVVHLHNESEIIFPELESALYSMLLAELHLRSSRGMTIFEAYLDLKSLIREDLHPIADKVFNALATNLPITDDTGISYNACTRCPIRLLHFVATLRQIHDLFESNEN